MPKKSSVCIRGHARIPANLNGRSCKICMHQVEKRARIARRKRDPLAYALNQLKRNARRRGIEFSITSSDLLPLPTHCPVFGVQLDYSGVGGPNAASVDRSNTRKGYTRDNVVIMSNRANKLKNDATADELQKIVDYLRNLDI